MMIKPQDDSKEMEKRTEASAKSTGHEKQGKKPGRKRKISDIDDGADYTPATDSESDKHEQDWCNAQKEFEAKHRS